MKNIVGCFSSYDTSWNANIELFDRGIKLLQEILLPAFILTLIGSCLPSTPLMESSSYNTMITPSCVNILSPYTPHSLALSSMQLSTPITMYQQHPIMSNFDPIYLLRLTLLSIISPTSIDMLRHIRPLMMQALNRFNVVLQSRKRADVSTKVGLLEKIKDGRVIHRHAYDLYLPPREDSLAKLDNPITSLLLLPGFGVHHEAYADVATQISEHGIPVAVVSLQPLRLAHAKLGGSMNDVRRVIKSAGSDVAKYYKSNLLKQDGKSVGNIVVEWQLGGHSMGGYAALQLAEELLKNGSPSITLNDGSISKVGSQIVVWAAGNMIDSVPNLQSTSQPSNTNLRTLILLGSNDNIAKFTSHRHKRQLLTKLPRGSRMFSIKGANHSGFASYNVDSSSPLIHDLNGQRDITLQAQQKEVSRRTAKWLLNDK